MEEHKHEHDVGGPEFNHHRDDTKVVFQLMVIAISALFLAGSLAGFMVAKLIDHLMK